MVKGGGKKEKNDGGPSAEEQVPICESKRLRDLAVSRGLLSRSKANPSARLPPTRIIRKCDGKDIVKNGHRKTKYLFAFPGLMAPIAGGKFGELTHLDSRNPTLYIDFPQGRLKMFGTIVYSKNKYMTMHFRPGRGDIVCEDCFENIVVFPEAWWIGTKEENPGEVQLEMPSDLQQVRHEGYTFAAGAARTSNPKKYAGKRKGVTVKNHAESPARQFPVERFQESQSPVDFGPQGVPLRPSEPEQTVKISCGFFSASEEQSRDSFDDSPDVTADGKFSKHGDEDIIPSQSSITAADISSEHDVHASTARQTAGEENAQNEKMGTAPGSTEAEWMPGTSGPRVHLKEGTLSAFLNAPDALQESANVLLSQGDGQSNTDSTLNKISTSYENDEPMEDNVHILDSQ